MVKATVKPKATAGARKKSNRPDLGVFLQVRTLVLGEVMDRLCSMDADCLMMIYDVIARISPAPPLPPEIRFVLEDGKEIRNAAQHV